MFCQYSIIINTELSHTVNLFRERFWLANDGSVFDIEIEYPEGSQLPMRTISYYYNGRGFIEQIEDSFGLLSRNFLYDDKGQLELAEYPDNRFFDYMYDLSGNRESFGEEINGNMARDEVYQYNGLDELEEVRDAVTNELLKSFIYDANGNVISESDGSVTKAYQWNYRDELTSINNGDYNFEYDAFHRRVMKETQSGVTKYFGDNMIKLELDADNNVKRLFIFDRDGYTPLVAYDCAQSPCAIHYYLVDHLSTPIETWDDSGEMTWQGVLEPFGAVISETGSFDNPLRFPGQWDDESGLYYNWFRYYQEDKGLYLSREPLIIINLGSLFQLYKYSESNPVSSFDFRGLAACKPFKPRNNYEENCKKSAEKSYNLCRYYLNFTCTQCCDVGKDVCIGCCAVTNDVYCFSHCASDFLIKCKEKCPSY